VGVVPRQYSTGGKQKLLGISKRGNRYLRRMLIHGARAVLFRVGRMEGVRSLTVLLGGRTSAEELAHPKVIHLEVLRVRGLAAIDLSGFPQLQVLRIEDQLQLRSVELNTGTLLRWLSIWNCKNLSSLPGLDRAVALNSLSLGRTALDPDTVLSNAPPSLKCLILSGFGPRRNEELENRIRSKGYKPAISEPDIGGLHV
jgi:hypothetical protein